MRNKAIILLMSDTSLVDLAKRLTPEFADDLLQDVTLLLLEMSDEKWQEIKDGGYLRFYVVRTIMTMATSPRSSFARKYGLFENRKPLPDIPEEANTSNEKEILLNELEKALNGCYWYDAELLKAYVNEGSYRKVQQKTGIPFRSVGNTVKKTIEQLKKEINGNLNKRTMRHSISRSSCRNHDGGCTDKRFAENSKKRKP